MTTAVLAVNRISGQLIHQGLSFVAEAIRMVKEESVEPRIEMGSKLRPAMLLILAACLENTPAKRITMQQLSARLKRELPHRKLIDSLVSRLGRYAEDLEVGMPPQVDLNFAYSTFARLFLLLLDVEVKQKLVDSKSSKVDLSGSRNLLKSLFLF